MHRHTHQPPRQPPAKALLAPSVGLGLRHVLRTPNIVPDDVVRGEGVPQDPSDEPTSVLLERIRAQRTDAPKPKRGRKPAAH